MTRSYRKTRPSRSFDRRRVRESRKTHGQGIGTMNVVIEEGATVATKL
jgi:hypothetical protein